MFLLLKGEGLHLFQYKVEGHLSVIEMIYRLVKSGILQLVLD